MRLLRPAAAVVIALSVAAVACVDLSYLSEGGELSDAGDDARESADLPEVGPGVTESGTDGSVSSEAGAADAAAPNLLTNGDFELGCAAWGTAFGQVKADSTARSGAGSCKFCMNDNWEAFLEQTVSTPVAANETYFAEVWTQGVLSPAELENAGFEGEEVWVSSKNAGLSKGPRGQVGATWQRVTSLVKTTAASDSVTISYRLQQAQPAKQTGGVVCVLVDDASLRRVP